MDDTRNSTTFRSRRPAQGVSAVQEPSSATNQRMQRFARYLNSGADIRLARVKTAEVEIRWLD